MDSNLQFPFHSCEHHAAAKVQFMAVLRKVLWHIGCDESQFASHSFQIGAAMSVTVASLSESMIQRIGQWWLGVFAGYIHLQDE